MDQRSSKRPRSDSKPSPPKKKQKKSKSSKQSGKPTEKETTHANPLEHTATAEGITMTELLRAFNPSERSRFEAFRRSTFRGDAIAEYVSHCLGACEERAYAKSEKTRQYLGADDLGVPEWSKRTMQHCPYVKNGATPARSLSDMVAPGQADEITVVVSTLAKAYAQRLVTAARRVAAAEGVEETQPLEPSHVRKAYHSRIQAGLDPGFFLQKPRAAAVVTESSAAVAAALGTVDENELKRNAALAAQEEYDRYMEQQKSPGEEMDVEETAEETGASQAVLTDTTAQRDHEKTTENVDTDGDIKMTDIEEKPNDGKVDEKIEPARSDDKSAPTKGSKSAEVSSKEKADGITVTSKTGIKVEEGVDDDPNNKTDEDPTREVKQEQSEEANEAH